MEGQRAEAAAGMEWHGRRLWEPEESFCWQNQITVLRMNPFISLHCGWANTEAVEVLASLAVPNIAAEASWLEMLFW